VTKLTDWSKIDWKKKGCLYLVPLGGVGEIGMNLMVLAHQGRGILIDCGIMFPEAAMLGVDLIVPNIQFLKESPLQIEGIVLTHGHEDHIGAVAYLYNDLKRPTVFGTEFTLALVEDRMREAGTLSGAKLQKVKVKDSFKVADFTIEALQVTHSICESMGLLIKTPIGSIVHSGDFKIDRQPIDGLKFDEGRFAEMGNEEVLLLMSDSTNVEREGWSTSESDVSKGIRQLFDSIKDGKIITAVFASNIHRIQEIYKAAKDSGRRVALCGRSMNSNADIAQRLKLLKLDPEWLIPLSDVEDYPPEEVAIIATGTQAEPRSALYRMSLNDHPDVKLNEGDTVIMSSRHIPGNERAISHLVNNLYRRGARVIDSDHALVHASGHAYREEQAKLLNWVKPKYFFPVHGEYRMLVMHADLAKDAAPKTHSVVAENGDVLELTPNAFRKIGRVPCGKIFLDEAAGDLKEELLRDRRQMAHTGVVVVSVVIDSNRATIIEGPDFDIRGVNDEIDLDSLKKELMRAFREHSEEARRDANELSEELRRVTRRFFYKANGVKPVVIPLVYEI
jgi:ribonuclease J